MPKSAPNPTPAHNATPPWPPNYTEVFRRRVELLNTLQSDPVAQVGAKEYYRSRPEDFIDDWCITYDPRNVGRGLPTTMPFCLFPRQRDLVRFLTDCMNQQESGLIEKCRDMGATWVCAAFSVWLYIYHPGSSTGWGSRKEQLVDKIGDPDSIFQKIRMILEYLPDFFKPKGYNAKVHASYMKIINPENGSTITGEAGDNIGRGGRKGIYFKDESAHYERPDKIEAALGDNTDVQIDISSVNGAGNVFHRRRQSGVVYDPSWSDEKKASIPKGTTRIFIMDWSDHPAKNQEWYDARRAKAEREGLLHVFMQEVDRDYSSAVEGILIPGRLVKACLDAHTSLAERWPDTYGQYTYEDWTEGTYYGGFDPYDEGLDSHALVGRRGSIITFAEMWFDGDTGDATRKVSSIAQEQGMTEIDFDSPGVGAGVKTESARLKKENLLPKHIQFIPWNGGTKVRNPNHFIFEVDDPDEQRTVPKNKDFFKNLKAQAGWALRTRCQKTFEALEKGTVFPLEDLLSIPTTLEPIEEFKQELSQPTYSRDGAGRIVIDKKPKGTKSPNLFDATVQAFFPIEVFDPAKGTFVGGPGVVRNERAHV